MTTKFDTQTKFSAKPKALSAISTTFEAQISPGSYQWSCILTWKPGFSGVRGFSARDESSMMKELTRLDSSVKFYKRASTETAQADANAQLAERMRVDATVSDGMYRSACKNLGVPPSARPDHTTEEKAVAVPLLSQCHAWMDFANAHIDELGYGNFGPGNEQIIFRFLEDFNLQATSQNIESAYQECRAQSYFRGRDTGVRGGRLVRPYNLQELKEARRARPAQIEPPVGLSAVDLQCWNLVQSQFPTLDVRSPEFRKKCSDQITAWARFRALESNPELAPVTDARGVLRERPELQEKISQIILGWAQQSYGANSQLGQGNKAARNTRIWLG